MSARTPFRLTHPLALRAVTYLRLAHFDRPADLPLLLWPVFWTSWLVSSGQPNLPALIALLLALLLFRGGAWVSEDLREFALKPAVRFEAQRFAVALGVAGLCFALPLGWPVLALAAGMALLAGGVLIGRRSFLFQPLLAVGMASVVPAAGLAQGVDNIKIQGLLLVAALLWQLSGILLHTMPLMARDRRSGIHSLALLFGRGGPVALALLQFGALFALWLAGRQAGLGVFFSLGLLAASGLTLHQQWLIRGGSANSYRKAAVNQFWWGAAVFCGFAFHYLCSNA